MYYAQETFLSISGLSGILGAIVLNLVTHWLSKINGGNEDLVDLIGSFIARGKGRRTGAGFLLLIMSGAILGVVYGSLLMSLQLSRPSLILGTTLLLGCIQGFAVTGVINRTFDGRRRIFNSQGGFISPLGASALAHAVFGLIVGGALALLASSDAAGASLTGI